jgi:hypothetical protein
MHDLLSVTAFLLCFFPAVQQLVISGVYQNFFRHSGAKDHIRPANLYPQRATAGTVYFHFRPGYQTQGAKAASGLATRIKSCNSDF